VVLGVSAAIAAAAIPNDNRAEAINLVMGSPNKGVDERCREYAGTVRFIRDEDHFTIPWPRRYRAAPAQAFAAWTRASRGIRR
jgi:hypothetical protein